MPCRRPPADRARL